MYEHGGVNLSTGPYIDPWDSGQVGFVRVTPESAEKVGLDMSDTERIDKLIDQEVADLAAYINGEIYAVTAHRIAYGDVLPTPMFTMGDIWDDDDSVLDDTAVEMLGSLPKDATEGITAEAVTSAEWSDQ